MAELKIKKMLRAFGEKVKREKFTRHWSGTMGFPCSEVEAKVVDAELDAIEAEIKRLLKARKQPLERAARAR